MFRKVISLVLVFILSLSVVIYAEENEIEFVGYDIDISSLEDLAGKRLYVYGLLDNQMEENVGIPILFLNEKGVLNRLDAVEIFYRLYMFEIDKEVGTIEECSFIDVPEEHIEAVTYLSSKGIINGISDTEFGVSECSALSFSTFVLRYLGITDIPYSESIDKLRELGLLKYVTLEDGFTNGDAYIIISNLLDYEVDGEKIIDTLELVNCREEIRIPKTINIYVTSFSDFKEKLDAAYFFAPDKITINLLDSCNELEAHLIYNFICKADYSWSGLFNDFYEISSVYSYTASGWAATFSEYFEEHWRLSDDERAKKAVELCNMLDILYEDEAFSIYGELSGKYTEYLQELVHFNLTADKKKITINTENFNDYVYLNLDILDWIKCYNNSEFTELIKKYLKDMDEYKDLSDYEKINKVHDYICRKATYDYNEYYGMMRENYDYKYTDAHEVKGFIIDGRIVCDGYAYTYQWLLDYLGVESVVVYGHSTNSGKSEGHAWNKVKLEDKWYNVDVCWADTGCGREYFLKSDDYFQTHYHIFEDDFLLPNLISEVNYSFRNK